MVLKPTETTGPMSNYSFYRKDIYLEKKVESQEPRKNWLVRSDVK